MGAPGPNDTGCQISPPAGINFTPGYTAPSLQVPASLAFDGLDNAWIGNCAGFCENQGSLAGSNVTQLAGGTTPPASCPAHSVFGDAGCPISPASTGYTNGLYNTVGGVALDHSGNVWVTSKYGGPIAEGGATELVGGQTPPAACPSHPTPSDTGCPIVTVANTGGILAPLGVAVDGAGRVWMINQDADDSYGGVSELAGGSTLPAKCPAVPSLSDTGCPLAPNGFNADHTEFAFFDAFTVAIDRSGNLWLNNYGSNSVSEMIGVATPVRTPLIGLVQPLPAFAHAAGSP